MIDIFCNRDLISNIRTVNGQMTINTNGGSLVTRKMGDLANIGPVWYDHRALTNILSLSKLKRLYRITYDSEDGDVFKVHKPNGEIIIFKCCGNGLYYHDTKEKAINLLNLVAENNKLYSERQYQR